MEGGSCSRFRRLLKYLLGMKRAAKSSAGEGLPQNPDAQTACPPIANTTSENAPLQAPADNPKPQGYKQTRTL